MATGAESSVQAYPTVWLGVLGPVTVTVDGAVAAPRPGRQRRLLTILAVATGHPELAGGDDLVQALYGSSGARAARHSLATELWRLRQLLGTDAVLTDADGYRLNPNVCGVDAVTFESHLAQGRALMRSDDPARAEPFLHDALALWRGDPLADLRDHSLGRAALARLNELRLGGIEDHAEALLHTDRGDDATALLEELVAVEPAREHAWSLLVECHQAAGRTRQARVAFDSARRTLAGYGVDLGTELRSVRPVQTHDVPPVAGPAHPVPSTDVLVGRDRELGAVVATVERAVLDHRPGLVVISGEAGIGKTALAEAAGRLLRARLGPVVQSRVTCDRRLQFPLAALRPLVDALGGPDEVPELTALIVPRRSDESDGEGGTGPSTPGAGGRGEDAVNALVAAVRRRCRGGLVLLVEDAHWATPAVLDLIMAVTDRAQTVPLCFVLTYRDTGSRDGTRVLHRLRAHATKSIPLCGLDLAAVAQLLGPSADENVVARTRRLTGGNPLYVRQLIGLDQSGPGGPATLSDALDEHLVGLDQETVDVLELAAVAGVVVDVRVLTAAAVGLPVPLDATAVADSLDAAVKAAFLAPDAADELAFVHDLVRDHLYRRIEVGRRRASHVLIAEATERLLPSDASSAELVAHHYATGWPACDTTTAVQRLRVAGEEAGRQLGFDSARDYYRRALDLLAMDPGVSDAETTAGLLYAAGQAAVAAVGTADAGPSSERLTEARGSLHTLHDFASRNDLPLFVVRSALALVRSFTHQRVDPDALDLLDSAVRSLLENLPAVGGWEAAGAVVSAAVAELCGPRPQTAHAIVDDTVTVRPDVARALLIAVWERDTPDLKLATARRLTADDGDSLAAWVRLWVSEVTAGVRSLDDAPPRPGTGGESSSAAEWEVQAWHTTRALATGRFERARRLLDGADAHIRSAASATEIAKRAAARMGQQVRLTLYTASEPVAPDLLPAPSTTWVTHPVMRPWFAYVAAATGRIRDAVHECEQVADDFDDGVIPEGDLLAWAGTAAFGAVRARHVRCMARCEEVLSHFAGRHAVFYVTSYLGAADLHLGRIAMARGEWDAAVAHLSIAATMHERVGARSFVAGTHHALAHALRSRGGAGDLVAAAEHADRAMTLAETIGLHGLAGHGPFEALFLPG